MFHHGISDLSGEVHSKSRHSLTKVLDFYPTFFLPPSLFSMFVRNLAYFRCLGACHKAKGELPGRQFEQAQAHGVPFLHPPYFSPDFFPSKKKKTSYSKSLSRGFIWLGYHTEQGVSAALIKISCIRSLSAPLN